MNDHMTAAEPETPSLRFAAVVILAAVVAVAILLVTAAGHLLGDALNWVTGVR